MRPTLSAATLHALSVLCAVSALLTASCDPPSATSAALTGSIEGVVVDPMTEVPVAGVRVRARDLAEATTDAEGHFVLEVPVGEHRLWLDRTDFVDGQYAHVRVEARRVTEVTAHIFQAAPDDALVAAYLARRPARRHAHPAHDRPDAQATALEPDANEVGSVRAALDDPVLPAVIRVWRSSRAGALEPSSANGWADNSCDATAMVETLALEEYVKGVVTHEWIPSWHPEALRAGSIAARTYAVNWAARGGRWDCADVDDGTVTQVYRDERTTPGDDAVDATAGMVVVRDEAIISTEYSAENTDPTAFDVADPTCTGTTLFGHGRGMCQWGTERWATGVCANPPCDFGAFGPEAKSYTWMVEHYYPGATVVTGTVGTVPPCKVIPVEGDILDDAGPCFDAFGDPMYWRTEAAGWDGGLMWTNAFEAATPSNWARWRLHFAAPGEYSVDTFIDPAFGVHKTTRYVVTHAGGEEVVLIDQGAVAGWTRLGTWTFDAEAEVRVLDNESAPVPADQHIVVDALQIKPTSATTDSGTPETDSGTTPTDGGDGVDAGMSGGGGGCGCRVGQADGRGTPQPWYPVLRLRRLRRGDAAAPARRPGPYGVASMTSIR